MFGSKRQQKIGRMLQRELGDIFLRDNRGILNGNMVSISEVRVSPDLSVAKVYISMMLIKNSDEMYEHLNEHKAEIRGELGRRIGKQVRRIPELIFYKDELEEQANRLDQLIDSLDIPPETEDRENEESP